MIRLFTLLLTLVTAGSATAANVCDDLWFTRNLMFDHAGYCFGSNLGKAVFDNSDCTTKDPVLSDEGKFMVAWTKDFEAAEGCNIDTTRTNLDVELMDWRRRLTHQGVYLGYESACLDWQGEQIPLYNGYSTDEYVIGWVNPSDDIYWELEYTGAPENWGPLMVRRNGQAIALGWSNYDIDEQQCGALAG